MTLKSQTVGALTCLVAFINTFGNPILFYVVPQEYGLYAYVTTFCMTVLVGLLDLNNSDNAWKNLEIMKQAGFSGVQLVCYGSYILSATPLAGWFLTTNMTNYNPGYEGVDFSYFSPTRVVLPALVMVLLTDGCFFMMHRLLHEQFPRIHLLHHCCVYSSACTNIFFHPLDFAMEFTLPVSLLWFLSNYYCEYPWLFTISYSMQSWYALTHDEWLGLPHTRHHLSCATGYFVYIQYCYADRDKERVRALVPTRRREKHL